MFNFQGPAALSVLVDSLLIIQHQVPFVKNFFEVFSDFLKVFQPPQNPHKLLLWAFQRLPLAGQLDYITTGSHTLSTGFLIFSTNFGRNFWAVCILWWVGVLAQVVGEDGGNGREKPSPLGGRWRGTRRMRGICPVVAPSSVTCGDSFPKRGKPQLVKKPIQPPPIPV